MPEILFPHHRIKIDAHIGALHLAADCEISAPWTVIFGPSGSGKSSILRAACGLIPNATVDFQRRTSPAPPIDTADLPRMTPSSWRTLSTLPTHHRDLAYAPQHTALFPHLCVLDNIRFPNQVCGDPILTAAESSLVDHALTLFHLHAHAARFPLELSGGERRRVALARAFAVPQAKLMMLDEPFTGLDRALRDKLLPAMQQHLAARNIPVLSVTHDVDEALLLNAEVIRLEEGHITAQGSAAEVLSAERARLLAALTPRE